VDYTPRQAAPGHRTDAGRADGARRRSRSARTCISAWPGRTRPRRAPSPRLTS
jgi:hypothetical protein